jgi:hypothetical protein
MQHRAEQFAQSARSEIVVMSQPHTAACAAITRMPFGKFRRSSRGAPAPDAAPAGSADRAVLGLVERPGPNATAAALTQVRAAALPC